MKSPTVSLIVKISFMVIVRIKIGVMVRMRIRVRNRVRVRIRMKNNSLKFLLNFKQFRILHSLCASGPS